MPFFYTAFGLNIRSDLCFDNWLTAVQEFSGKPDLVFKIAPIKDYLPNYDSKLEKRDFVENLGDKILFAREFAKFLIIGKETIIVEPKIDAKLKTVQTCIFSNIMALLLQKMGYLTIHGCGIASGDRAYIFVGHCAMGKSTLALAFSLLGYKIVSDDLSAIRVGEDYFWVLPSYDCIKVLPMTAEKLNIDIDQFESVVHLRGKRFFPLKDKRCSNPLPVKHICILDSWESQEFALQKLHGIKKTLLIEQHMHNFAILRSQDFNRRYFQQSSDLIANTPVSIVRRPKEGFLLNELVNFIKKTIMAEERQ